MLAMLMSGIGAKIISALASVVGAVVLFFAVRKSGVAAQQTVDLKATLKHVEAANAAHDTVARLSDDAVDQRLRKQFSRD